LSPSNQAWRVGVEVPDPARHGSVQRIVRITDGSIATSGDYRNFLEQDGHRYSHTVDPRNGHPIAHDTASVSVIHPSAMWADGYATLLNVLGEAEGLAFANTHGLAAMFIVRGENGLEERYTPSFESALLD
ncbi:MAG: FAD:protein FMN transferase, partial [Pseudomonadales bacterium]